MNLLAQSLPAAGQTVIVQGEAEWKFWLVFVMCLISSIFMPMIAGTLKNMWARLKEGDNKFDIYGNRITVVETNHANLAAVCSKLATTVERLADKMTDFNLEGHGAIEAARREMLKEFASKDEVEKLEQKIDDNHAETMEAIRSLQGNN